MIYWFDTLAPCNVQFSTKVDPFSSRRINSLYGVEAKFFIIKEPQCAALVIVKISVTQTYPTVNLTFSNSDQLARKAMFDEVKSIFNG